MAILERDWFGRDTLAVASDLLGKTLVAKMANGDLQRAIICETEAYNGIEDKASHASKGRTMRTEIMFGDAGYWYVYLCYGVHWMLNVTTREEGFPAAVLIRGVTNFNGPGKLTKALGIDKRFNTMPLSDASGLWIEDDGIVIKKNKIKRSPRIGIDYAGPVWSKKPWRFYFED